MSSVSSKSNSTASASSQDDVNRKAREDYSKNEAELIKKHNRQVRMLNDKHVRELDEINKRHSANLNQATDRSRSALSERDVKYQKEIEDLRRMHTGQVEKLLEDNQQKLETQRRTAKLEIEQSQLGKNDRTQELHKSYSEMNAQEREKFREQLGEVREKQRETIREQNEKLKSSHEKEADGLRRERNEAIVEMKNQYRALQRNAAAQKRHQDIRHMSDRMRTSNAHMDNIKNLDVTHNTIQDMSREGHQESLREVRERMGQAHAKQIEADHSIREKFNTSVEDRVEGQVNRLKRDLASQKERVASADQQAKMNSRQEVNNIQDAYQEKFEYLEDARKQTLDQQNELRAKDIRRVREEANKQMFESSRYYRGKMEVENFRNKTALDYAEKDFALRTDYQKQNADGRVDKIRNESFSNESKLRENFQSNVEMLKEVNTQRKRDLIVTQQQERVQSEGLLKEQMQKQEVDHQKRMNDVVSRYEKRLSSLNDQVVRDKRVRENREKQLVRDMKRQHESEIEALRLQYEGRNKATLLTHERELRDTTRRQQEKMDELLTTVRKSQT